MTMGDWLTKEFKRDHSAIMFRSFKVDLAIVCAQGFHNFKDTKRDGAGGCAICQI